ncbi:MAG: hypothetical protein MO847_08510 [Candidatus Protistobacter heckmanni]|nr:hypothetical protein [Candidatus Protistobacter heckmanni]
MAYFLFLVFLLAAGAPATACCAHAGRPGLTAVFGAGSALLLAMSRDFIILPR